MANTRIAPQGPLSAAQLYDMKLHEYHDVIGSMIGVLRVAGGWVYMFSSHSTFVPFDNEFQRVGLVGSGEKS